MAKRLFDLFLATLGVVFLAPLLIALGVAVKLDSPGPVFFRQERVGRYGKIFRIHKFRTMVADAERHGPQLTVADDPRITQVGRLIRRFRLDELPQLIDVMEGTMSLVGPRPEVPQYLAYYPPEARHLVLSVRPGITDWASVAFRDENAILARFTDPHRGYVEEILPGKLAYYVDYVKTRSFLGDLKIIICTIVALLTGKTPRSLPDQRR